MSWPKTYYTIVSKRRYRLFVVTRRLTSTMTYYGASINSTNLAGNKYINFSLLGLAEVPGYILIFFTMTW